jgi:hypothetical protein
VTSTTGVRSARATSTERLVKNMNLLTSTRWGRSRRMKRATRQSSAGVIT